MTEHYSQTVDVQVSREARVKQMLGIAFALVSLGFIMLSAFLNWLYMIGFGIALIVGLVFIQLYNLTPKSYTYDFSIERLIIAKTSVINRTTRLVSIMFCDVKRFDLMSDLLSERDIVASNSVNERGVYELVYRAENGENRRVLFAPDDYMIELIREILAEKAKYSV